MLELYQKPFIQNITEPWMENKGFRLFIKREDVIHPYVSGNKWRKLKYNLVEARKEGHDTLLTFGGAYSNHIYATAAAAKEAGFHAIGIIRGDELAQKPLNETLRFAQNQGMKLHFIERMLYRQKAEPSFIKELKNKFGEFYLIPEGGTNNLAIKGAQEILTNETEEYDIICCAVGTGGTVSGIITAAKTHQEVIGISVLKGGFLSTEVSGLLEKFNQEIACKWRIEEEYHFGGYAKETEELRQFVTGFSKNHNIPIEPIYTGKMLFGIYDLMRKGLFASGKKVLVIHTGGLR